VNLEKTYRASALRISIYTSYIKKFGYRLKPEHSLKFNHTLVPKLRLGNPEGEAPASRDGKLELPRLRSQSGDWEQAQNMPVCIPI